MSDSVLKIENLSKLYTLGTVGTGTLTRDLNRWWATSVLGKEDPFLKIGEVNRRDVKGSSDVVWALNDVSLDVKQGDVVGLIGSNGSGKSTLLKIISRITLPSKGVVKAKGRVASLLEVGTGFHSDLTGRENIYMNGAILGMSRREINRKMDDIIEFSRIERYIDTPVKRYSSGMKVRLGFSVAAFLEPEILLVDEVLAVGDVEFQQRAIGKIQSIVGESGRTVIFVSHNLNSVIQLCNRGVLLEDGSMIFDGSSEDAVKKYLESKNRQNYFEGIDGNEAQMYLTRARIWAEGADADSEGVFTVSQPIGIEMDVAVATRQESVVVGFNVVSQFGYSVARSDFNDRNQLTVLDEGRYRFYFEIPPHTLAPGSYVLRFELSKRHQRKYTNDTSDLYFDIVPGTDNFGGVYARKEPRCTSLIRADWVKGFTKLN